MNLIFSKLLKSHQWDDMFKQMAVAMSSIPAETRLGTDVLGDQNLGQMPAFGQLENPAQSHSIIRQVHMGPERVVGGFVSEIIESQSAPGFRKLKKTSAFKDPSIEVAEDRARWIASMIFNESDNF